MLWFPSCHSQRDSLFLGSEVHALIVLQNQDAVLSAPSITPFDFHSCVNTNQRAAKDCYFFIDMDVSEFGVSDEFGAFLVLGSWMLFCY